MLTEITDDFYIDLTKIVTLYKSEQVYFISTTNSAKHMEIKTELAQAIINKLKNYLNTELAQQLQDELDKC